MSNNLRTRNGLPFNFVNGLRVRGQDIESLIPGIEGIPEAGSKYQFAGNGVNKIFTLPVSPYNKDAIDVHVKQLYVHPDDYVLVGDTVTLMDAPPALSVGETHNVVIKVNLTTLNGYVNANRVSFEGEQLDVVLQKSKPIANYVTLRAYTGASSQVHITDPGVEGLFYWDASDTVSADNGGTVIVSSNGRRWKRHFEGVINVKWFGAIGNGTNDDTAAFNAALNVGTSTNVIFVPPGFTYRITSTLSIVGNKTLTGYVSGTQNFQPTYILHEPVSTGPLFSVQSASNGVRVSHLTVIGGNGSFCIESSNQHVLYDYIKMQAYNGSGIRLLSSGDGSSSSKLINCSWIGPSTATDYTGFEIIVNGGDVHMRGCTATHGAIGINIAQGQTVIIDGCSVNKQSRYGGHSSATQANTCGIKLSGAGYKQAISIRNSYIETCENGISVDSCESLTIADNLIYDNGVAGVVGAWIAYGNSSIRLNSADAKNITIQNNHITALSNGAAGNTFYALAINNATNVLVLNNTITTTGDYNAQFYTTTATEVYGLNNKRQQSGSNPQPDYDLSGVITSLSPKLQPWVTPTFVNEWASNDSAAYSRDASGEVRFRNYITSGVVGTVAFNLPVGFRPKSQESFIVNSNGSPGIITVFTNGDVVVAAGNNAYVYLSDIRFSCTD